MAETSKIQWTDATWNIAVGCSKVDDDCKYCYMFRSSLGGTRYEPRVVRKTKTVFNLPLKLKEPSMIFTSSLTDVFHEDCDSFRDEMWDIIRRCPQHTFQILTKRPERIRKLLPADWGEGYDNVWLGASVGSQKAVRRIYDLCQVPAKLRFLSLEPLHDAVDLTRILSPMDGTAIPVLSVVEDVYPIDGFLGPVHWVIVGGESGNDKGPYRYRPCSIDWIKKIIDDCKENAVPVFVKQLGTALAKEMKLTDRHGGNPEEWPEFLRIREFPTKK